MDWRRCEETWPFPKVEAADNTKIETDVLPKKKKIKLSSILQPNSNDLREFVCGWGSAVINITVTYPINKIIFRQILDGVPASAAIRQLKQEGVSLLYRGILPPLCQKTLSLSIMFSVYEGSKERISILTGNEVLAKILAANIAGATEATLMPLERVQTLLQDYRYHNKFKNTTHAFRYILTKYGVHECYRGFVPIIYRNGLSNLTFFTLRDKSKELMGDRQSILKNFFYGAVIGGFTSTVFYPFNVIKIHMQTKIGGNFDKFTTAIRELYVARNRSLTSFYKGVHLNYMRSFISWGVINAAYDFLKKIVF